MDTVQDRPDTCVQSQRHSDSEPRPNLSNDYFDANGPREPLPAPGEPVVEKDHAPYRERGKTQTTVDAIVRWQDELRDEREDVMGRRFALKTQRRTLINTFQKAGALEGSLISKIRQVFQEQHIQLPPAIQNDFSRLLLLRDNLGTLDVDYEQAEQNYNMVEWQYTQKEGRFIDKLLGEENPSEYTAETQHRKDETEQLTRHASGLGPETSLSSLTAEETGMAPTGKSFALLVPSPEHPTSTEKLDTLKIPATPSATSKDTWKGQAPASLPLQRKQSTFANVTAPSLSYSESALPTFKRKWPETRRRIDEWILGTVECSNLERERLRRSFKQPNLDDKTWWELLQQCWASDDTSFPLNTDNDSVTSHESAHDSSAQAKRGSERNAGDITANLTAFADMAERQAQPTTLPSSIEIPQTFSQSDLEYPSTRSVPDYPSQLYADSVTPEAQHYDDSELPLLTAISSTIASGNMTENPNLKSEPPRDQLISDVPDITVVEPNQEKPKFFFVAHFDDRP